MVRDIAIVHFNTPELTAAAVMSIRKNTPDARITIFDNSDKRPFEPMEEVNIFDNTAGQIIDFKGFLDQYPNKQHTTCNKWGSAKHCYTIDYLWGLFPDGFVLMDSDVLVKKDISIFFDEKRPWVGTTYVNPDSPFCKVPRLLPFLCWINVPMCQSRGVRYFDGYRNWKLRPGGPDTWYDTGASFLEDCIDNGLDGLELDINDYIEHLSSGSVLKTRKAGLQWLEKHEDLWKRF